MTQLALDLGLERPVVAVAMCHRCGLAVGGVEIADAGDPWNEAVLWGYVAVQAHLRDGCSAARAAEASPAPIPHPDPGSRP